MKAKKILLFIIILLLVVAIAIAVIYFKTDIFKTTPQKFWKYANKNSEVMEMFNNNEIQSIKNRRSNNPYTITSNLNVRNGADIYNFTANTNASDVNNISTDVSFKLNNKDIANFTLVKKSNLFAFMMRDLANGFIAIKNNNIQELAKEAGMEDVSNIPDSINWFSMIDLLYIQESDAKYFVDTYSKLIMDNTSKENYSTEESEIKIDNQIHQVTGYKIVLTEKESKELAKRLLIYMKNDDARAINFISSRLKLLNLPKKYTEYEVITNKITDIIEKLDSIETTDEQFLEATIYVEKGQTLQTNIKIKDGSVIKIIFKKDENKLFIVQEEPNEDLIKSNNEIIKYIGNIKEITLSNELGDDNNSSTLKLNAEFFNNFTIVYDSKITIGNSGEGAIDFDKTPRIVLNEMETEKLKQTYNTIMYGFGKIFENKKALISSYTNVSNTTIQNTQENTTEENQN